MRYITIQLISTTLLTVTNNIINAGTNAQQKQHGLFKFVLALKTFSSPQTNQFIDYPMRRQRLKSKNRDNIPIPLCKVGTPCVKMWP